jgi:hypothetical protein
VGEAKAFGLDPVLAAQEERQSTLVGKNMRFVPVLSREQEDFVCVLWRMILCWVQMARRLRRAKVTWEMSVRDSHEIKQPTLLHCSKPGLLILTRWMWLY